MLCVALEDQQIWVGGREKKKAVAEHSLKE